MSSARDVLEMARAFLGGSRGYVTVWKVFIDKSGIHDQSDVVTVAAYVATPKQWSKFVPAWRAAIKPAKAYHAADAAALRGDFKNWTGAQVADVCKRALPVIVENTSFAAVGGINLKDYRAALEGRPELERMFGSPYGACLQWALTTVLEWKQAEHPRQMVSFVHEVNNFRREAWEVFDHVKAAWNADHARMSFAFGSKEDFVPLQAADILALEMAKRLKNVAKPERKAFKALRPRSGKMAVRAYDRSDMPELVRRLEDVRLADGLGALGSA